MLILISLSQGFKIIVIFFIGFADLSEIYCKFAVNFGYTQTKGHSYNYSKGLKSRPTNGKKTNNRIVKPTWVSPRW